MSKVNDEIRSAIEQGDLARARQLLPDALKDPTSETYYLASLAAFNDGQRDRFLTMALDLDPDYDEAKAGLKAFHSGESDSAQPEEPAAEPVIDAETKEEAEIPGPATVALAQDDPQGPAVEADELQPAAESASKGDAEKKKAFPFWILIVAAILILIPIFAWFYFSGDGRQGAEGQAYPGFREDQVLEAYPPAYPGPTLSGPAGAYPSSYPGPSANASSEVDLAEAVDPYPGTEESEDGSGETMDVVPPFTSNSTMDELYVLVVVGPVGENELGSQHAEEVNSMRAIQAFMMWNNQEDLFRASQLLNELIAEETGSDYVVPVKWSTEPNEDRAFITLLDRGRHADTVRKLEDLSDSTDLVWFYDLGEFEKNALLRELLGMIALYETSTADENQ